MLVWNQDGTAFVYLEKNKCFWISSVNEMFVIMADDFELGAVETEEEAKNVLVNIASAFVAAVADVDPW